jgi:hypothetical protein
MTWPNVARREAMGSEAAALNKLNEGVLGVQAPMTQCPGCDVYLKEMA